MAIKIFIDQGHNPGGVNAGAEGFGLREQDITYNVGVYLRDLLVQDGRFEVRLSRNTPEEVLGTNNTTSLRARVEAANSWPADYFISIHPNSNPNPAINGSEVYVHQTYTQAYFLAQDVLQGIVDVVGTKDNGVRAVSYTHLCDMMQDFNKYPVRIRDEVYATLNPVKLMASRMATRLIYSCKMCEYCSSNCPKGIDMQQFLMESRRPVSYTHLDVYKRQVLKEA